MADELNRLPAKASHLTTLSYALRPQCSNQLLLQKISKQTLAHPRAGALAVKVETTRHSRGSVRHRPHVKMWVLVPIALKRLSKSA